MKKFSHLDNCSRSITFAHLIERPKNYSSDEVFPHFVWEKSLTSFKRKIGSASPKSPSDFPNFAQISEFASSLRKLRLKLMLNEIAKNRKRRLL